MITQSVKRIPILLMAVFAAVYLSGMTALAVEVPDMDRTGSVTVTMLDPETGEGIQGEELILFRVAEIHKENDADYSFALTGGFVDCGEDLSKLGDKEPDAELAERLNDYRTTQKLSGTKLISNSSGRVVFSGLKTGLYLVAQGKSAKGYYEISPFLISVPFEENGEYIYDVDAAPKMELEKKPVTEQPPEDQVKTGDNSHIALWGAALVASVLIISAGIVYKRRKTDKEK